MVRGLTPDPEDDATFDMLQTCCGWIAEGLEGEAFLDRMASEGPRRFAAVIDAHHPPPMLAAQRDTDTARLFRLMGWSLLGSVPLPGHGFRPQRPALPGRNEACLCGSGAKFKHCCAPLLHGLPGFDADLLGILVIQALPASRWASLAAEQAPPRLVLGAAEWMLDDDRAADARRLLEPWSLLPPPWPNERAELLDRLGDTYLDLHQPRKRKQLALDMVAQGAAAVQAKGWQRLSLLATDAGDDKGARQAFLNAQRLLPDDPNLALLEVTTLMGLGEHQTARERAAFHVRRLSKLPPTEGLSHAIAVLAELSHPESGLARRAMREFDNDGPDAPPDQVAVVAGIGELDAWLASLAAPKLRLGLPKAAVSDLGALCPNATLQRALVKWRQVFDVDTPVMIWDEADDDQAQQALASVDWMPVLRKHPILADHFDVLNGLMVALQGVDVQVSARTLARLLGRALDLWRLIRQAQPTARCEWASVENRPALRLLGEAIALDTSPRADNTFEPLRHLVEVLNPNDNQGFRERLAAVYLRRGDLAAAATLVARYPDDGVGMTLLQARTRLAEGQHEAAAALVHQASKRNPHLRKALLAARAPREPDVDAYALGSIEEARIVVANQFDLWRGDPVVRAWLKQVLDGAIGPAAPPGLFGDPPT